MFRGAREDALGHGGQGAARCRVFADSGYRSRTDGQKGNLLLFLVVSGGAKVPHMVKGDSPTSLLSMRAITKSFAGVAALRGVDLEVAAGGGARRLRPKWRG